MLATTAPEALSSGSQPPGLLFECGRKVSSLPDPIYKAFKKKNREPRKEMRRLMRRRPNRRVGLKKGMKEGA
jgi:hypothetical protein